MGEVEAWERLARGLRQLPRRRSRAALRPAAVLVPLVWRDDGLQVLLTRRPRKLSDHPGQVACPGGKLLPGEQPLDAALRETEEELGIPQPEVQPLGPLHDIDVVVSGFVMTPWVGRLPDGLELRPDPNEVERAFYVPLDVLADTERSQFELKPKFYKGITYDTPYWRWDGELIWGATGRVLMDLLRLLYPEFPRYADR